MHATLPPEATSSGFIEDALADGADELSWVRFGDGKRLLYRAAGRTSMPLVERLASEGTDDSELERLETLWSLLAPTRVGHFLELGRTVRRGWHFPCPLSLDRARGAVHSGWPNVRLALFSARHGITSCSELARATNGEPGCIHLRLELPANDTVEIALDAFATFCLEPPPRAFWLELRDAEARLAVDLSLSADDADVALRVIRPSGALVEGVYEALGQPRPAPSSPPLALLVEPALNGFQPAVERVLTR